MTLFRGLILLYTALFPIPVAAFSQMFNDEKVYRKVQHFFQRFGSNNLRLFFEEILIILVHQMSTVECHILNQCDRGWAVESAPIITDLG